MQSTRKKVRIRWPKSFNRAQRNAWREVVLAYESALSDLDHDPTAIFGSESGWRRYVFEAQRQWAKQWLTRKVCIHPGCSSMSIARSHAISLGASLRLIEEEGHVVTPKFRRNGIEMVSIGVHEASTFPGFCTVHEAQFAQFEMKKQMTSFNDFYLQSFRTLSREIFTQQHYKRKLTNLFFDYTTLKNQFLTTRIKQARNGGPNSKCEADFSNDSFAIDLARKINDRSTNLAELDVLRQGVLDAMNGNSNNTCMTVGIINTSLPVCLSGFAVLPYMAGERVKHAYCFLAILPEKNESKIIMGSTKEHERALSDYLLDESYPALLDRLESWMCHGSDHWFMKPSAWEAIPQDRKHAICARIAASTHSIATAVGFSVLDEPRRFLLRLVQRQLDNTEASHSDISELHSILTDEQAKLDWTRRN
jgi:hypothetical protein